LSAEIPKMQRLTRVAQAFTPSAPVSRLDMLAGRIAQIQDVANAVSQRGQHVALYGERGVGKTSLANVLAELFDAPDLPHFQAVLVNCGTDDSYATIWNNIFVELGVALAIRRPPRECAGPSTTLTFRPLSSSTSSIASRTTTG